MKPAGHEVVPLLCKIENQTVRFRFIPSTHNNGTHQFALSG